jgi:putative hemolysin
MVGELLIVIGLLGVCLWATYVIALGAMQMLRLSDDAEFREQHLPHRQRRLADALAQNPHDVILTAALSKSVLFLLMILLTVWFVTRWAAAIGWAWIPSLVAGLLFVWLMRILVGEVLTRAAAEKTSHISHSGLVSLSTLWWLLSPLVFLLKRPGVRNHARRSAEEREEMVERALETLSHSAGMGEPVIEDDERKMIRGVIRLETKEVREVMVPRIHIIALEADASVDDVRRATDEHGHSRFPIYEEDLDSIIGILYVKDLFTRLPELDEVNLASLARDAFVVPETKKVDALLEELKRRKTHIAIVVDEFGGTAGLVTLEDILEEIVGEIEDEHDAHPEPLSLTSDGAVLADGVVPLHDVAAKLNLEIPEERFETVGGLIYDRVGGVPEVGQTIEEYGLTIRIEAVDGQRINRVRVTRAPADSQLHS